MSDDFPPMFKTMRIRKLKALNGMFWYAVDESDMKVLHDGTQAPSSYPLLDLTKPMGERSLELPDEMDGVETKVMILLEGYAFIPNYN